MAFTGSIAFFVFVAAGALLGVEGSTGGFVVRGGVAIASAGVATDASSTLDVFALVVVLLACFSATTLLNASLIASSQASTILGTSSQM